MDNSNNKQTESYKLAIASSDGIVVNQHFGKADTFYIYEVDENENYRLLEKRKVTSVCKSGNHEDDELKNNIRILKDCRFILVSRIGSVAANIVEQEGITPMELPGMIHESIEQLIKFEKLKKLFQ